MKLRINLKQALAAAALVGTAAFTVACSSAAAGTPSAGTVASTAAQSTSAPASTSASPSKPSPTTEIDEPTTTTVVVGADLDRTTEAWLETSCTGVETLIGSLFAVPTVDGTSSDEEYRDAYVTYYSDLTDTLFGITQDLESLDAPTFEGGQELHDGLLAYLNDVSSVTLGAAVIIQSAPDRASVDAAIEQINTELQQLGDGDYGMIDFQGEELQALMAQVPACAGLLTT